MEAPRYRAIVDSLAALRGRPAIAEVAATRVVRYRTDARPGIPPLADVFVPGAAHGASVILIHGGGFVLGSRRMKPMRVLTSHLVGAGFTVCAIDYRMIFRGGRLDEALADVCDAVAFWRTQAPDPAAITLVGLSAGGALAMLAASRAEASVARLVCCFGVYEMGELDGASAVLPRLLFRTSDRAIWRARSPRGARQPNLPTLLLHGDADGIVPVGQARRLAAHRTELGLPTQLVVYPDAPHGFFNMPCAAADAAVGEIIAFAR